MIYSTARHRGYLGCNHCERVGPGISLWECSPAYGLLRRSTKRGFQWQANQTRKHHQDRQRAPATHRCRSRMDIVVRQGIWYGLRRRRQEHFRRGERDCVEVATPTAQQAVFEGAAGKDQRKSHYSSSSRAAGLYLGYWNQSRDYFQAASCGLTTTKNNDFLKRKS